MHRPRPTWHARGTWNPREDRLPSVVWLALLWAGILAGFGTDMGRFLHENPTPPLVVDVHAFVFTGWMILLTAQVSLVVGNRIAWHRTLGWVTAGWACLMAVLGPWAAIASQILNFNSPGLAPAFLSVQLGGITSFLVFVAVGISLRKNSAAHKRIMILSTIALVDAGYGRFSQWLWPNEPTSRMLWFFWECYGSVLIMALMIAWDWWRGRLMKQFLLGTLALVALECAETLLYFWSPWKTATTSFIVACAKLHS
ncbi:MAG TPA: hypothetical protein VMU48_11930 [Terracidiphilus sp.]|nr:hypothetical protein [Terracidiphilus sp.]